MRTQSAWAVLMTSVGIFLIAEAVILAVTGLICWLIGWRTLWIYADAATYVGAAIIVLGVYSLVGSGQFASNFRYRFSQTVMDNSLHERTKQNMMDVAQSKSFSIVAGICGLTTILVGVAVKTLAY